MEKDVNRLDTSLRRSKTLISPHGIDLHSSCFKLVRENREGFSTNLSPTFFLGKRSILQHGEKHPFDILSHPFFIQWSLFPTAKLESEIREER